MTQIFSSRYILLLLFLLLGQSQSQSQSRWNSGEREEREESPSEISGTPPFFTAVSPLYFQPGTNYTVLVTVNPDTNEVPLQLKCVLMAESDESLKIESNSTYLRPGESGNISIPLPEEMPENEERWRLFAWSVKNDSEPDSFKHEAPYTLITPLVPSTKARLDAIFIQTDKPVYKPDDLVQFRVITMGTDDLPYLTSGLNITIIDSQRNVMKKWEQPLQLSEEPVPMPAPSNVSTNESVARKKNGLTSYEYQLSSEPILGNWTIQVKAGKIEEGVYFDVRNYILPKFQVKVSVPPVLYGRGEMSTAAKIEAFYTYGKGLQGIATVTASTRFGRKIKTEQFEVEDGKATVELKLSSSNWDSVEYTITANVSEKNTGRWQIGKGTVRIYPEEKYSIQWINKPSSYKPGFPITVKLKIVGGDGLPVRDVRKKALRITFPSPLNLRAQEISIPLSGIATFNFPTPIQPLSADSKFHVQYKRARYNFTLPTAEVSESSSGILIRIAPAPETPSTNLIPGNAYNLSIQSNKPIRPEPDVFYCLLWADSATEVQVQTIRNNRKGGATEFPFKLRIPKTVQRELKVSVSFEIEEDGKKKNISASKTFYMTNFLHIRVSKKIQNQQPQGQRPQDGISTFNGSQSLGNNSAVTEQESKSKLSTKLQVQPGDSIQIHFETYPDSTVAIRGIDQSLLLLLTEQNQDNDLNPAEIEEKQKASKRRAQYLENIAVNNSAPAVALRKGQTAVLNNTRFTPFQTNFVEYGDYDVSPQGGLAAVSFGGERGPPKRVVPKGGEHEGSRISAPVPVVDSRLRTKFPETWLWEEFQSSSDSSATTTVLTKNLPDTLTSWVISGFSLNSKTGLGVGNLATVTGFMPFFVTLNLPYSVIKNETFDLQVIVHNYLDRDVNVSVTLINKQNSFSFVNNQNDQTGNGNGNGNETHQVLVVKNQVALVHFVITPLVIGDIPIEVKAVTEDGTAGDSMIRPLKVKPDGVRRSQSQLKVFTRPENKAENPNLSREVHFEVHFSENAVKGASALKLTVVGDPMGSMVSNLDHLLTLPGGCGEQNMARFVPNILALDYLNATNSDAKEIMKQAKTNLEKGYAWQLQYKKSDGSFAIYADRDGTTWLTAYVLKWFVVAQKYITIDLDVIRGAINFIRRQQKSDGSFKEIGKFYHPEMQGRTNSQGVALTAYITLALIEANERSTIDLDLNLDKAIEKGLQFISQESVYQLNDNYITNLVTATLIKGNHPQKTHFFKKMEKGANTTMTKEGTRVKYWDMKNTRERASGPLAIEMTSYALLAHLWKEGQGEGEMEIATLNIQRWLLNQQGPHGGFISTQDTTMGLTALTHFALKTLGKVRSEDELELNIQAASHSSAINDTEFSVTVARWNRMVLQEFPLPVTTKKVNVRGTGNGPALIQVTKIWHEPTEVRKDPKFNITAKMTIPDSKDRNEAELKLCVNSLKESGGAADSIASIELPSGYRFFPEDFEQGKKLRREKPENVQRFDLTEEDTKLDVYYSSIQEPPTCINFPVTRVLPVADAKSPPILVYEYLNPENKASVNYEPAHKITVHQLCDITGACNRLELE